MKRKEIIVALAALLLLNSAWLVLDDRATIWNVANILGHVPLAVVVVALGMWISRQRNASGRRTVLLTLAAAAASGIAVVWAGNIAPNRSLLLAHIAAGVVALAVLFWALRPFAFGRRTLLSWVGGGAAILAALILWPRPEGQVISNPLLSPESLAEAAMGGAGGPFFPSAAHTSDGELIPEEFFLESESCGRSGCHEDVTDQWRASAHHLSSFNNPWYSKSIEYMQEVAGLERPKWCAGCHDHALLFPGQFERPVAEFEDTPAAQAGLACVSCHAITRVAGTMGNGGIEITYPPMHELATSPNPALRWLHDLILRLDPDPHRTTFLKPFHEQQPAEFCSSCHKVHLDRAVNDYRWVRGFNTYDNWQASGVSGQGARSFYEPAEPRNCLDCHMPRVPSGDAGAVDGLIRSHDYAAANTALPTLTGDSEHLGRVTSFLEAGQIRLDIFAVGEPVEGRRPEIEGADGLRTATTFAVGEEQGMATGGRLVAIPATPVRAPLTDGSRVLVPGSTSRIDVVVRTAGLGHFFPTGTVDAQEAWLELEARDQSGEVLLWSGRLREDGTVDPSAHFYRSFMIDAHAKPIDKRNAFAARSAVYVNLIPPGAADVARYSLFVPESVRGDVQVTASLRYRKFTWAYTQFSFRGERDPEHPGEFGVGFDTGRFRLAGSADGVPQVPVVTMARATRTLSVVDGDPEEPESTPGDSLRWNDYGIGLLLQGDLRGAESAFREVTRLAPRYADGWVNLGRVYIQEGDLERAFDAVGQALSVRPDFHKALYLRGLYRKALGDYAAALQDFASVNRTFPRDRVVLNQMGRVHYLDGDLEPAVQAFESVLRIDPEDLMAHYNLMLCHRALGNEARSEEHRRRYVRYKADESTQELAREYRATDRNVNNESLPIHMHGGGMGGN